MAARWILSLVQFRFEHPNQFISCISFIFSSVINCSFPSISPCKHCYQFRYSGGLVCVSLPPAAVSDCLCLHKQVTDHKALVSRLSSGVSLWFRSLSEKERSWQNSWQASRVHLSIVKVQRRNIPKRPLITKVKWLGMMQKIRDIVLHFYHFFFYFC